MVQIIIITTTTKGRARVEPWVLVEGNLSVIVHLDSMAKQYRITRFVHLQN